MVRFQQRLDRNKKIYLPKVLREAGFDESVEIIPDFKAAVMFPSGTRLTEVKKSLEVLLQEIGHRISSESRNGREN